MSCRNRAASLLLCLVVVAGLSCARAEPAAEILPTESKPGTWTVDFGAAGEKGKAVESSTSEARGYRFKNWLPSRDLLLLEEEFEDGARYTVYRDGKGKLSKLYDLDDMLAIWKVLPAAPGGGGDLLFMDDSSDYDSIERVIRSAKLFTIIAVGQARSGVDRLSCGFRAPDRILAVYKTRPDGESDGEFLLNGVTDRSMLNCRKARARARHGA